MGFLYSQLFITPTYPTRSFAGETCIVTGSNTGLGKEAARHLVRLGASKVIIACRNISAGEAARQDILDSTKADPSVIEVWNLDLGSFDSVKAFAKQASEQLPRVDVLLESAGIAAQDYKAVEGHESNITVNVISTFLLAFLMMPKLKAMAQKYNTQPRVAIVSSEVHAEPKFPEGKTENIFEALDNPNTETMSERYQASKLLEILVVRQIAPKLKDSGVILNLLNPGLCQSTLSKDMKFPANVIMWIMQRTLARTAEVGSRTLVASAAAGEESHGKYMSDAVVSEHDLSAFVQSEDGNRTGAKVWQELKTILEKIEPGVSGNL